MVGTYDRQAKPLYVKHGYLLRDQIVRCAPRRLYSHVPGQLLSANQRWTVRSISSSLWR